MKEDLRNEVDGFVPSPDAVWEVRSDVLALRALLKSSRLHPKRDEAMRLAEEISDICDNFYKLLNNLMRNLTAKGYTQLATLFDLATVGSLAMHDLVDGRWTRIRDLLLSAFSEGSMLMASLQYVKASEENLKAMTEEHISNLYGYMWDLVLMTRGDMGADEVRVARDGLDAFFKGLREDETAIEARLVIMVQLYTIVLKMGCDRFLGMLDERALGLKT